MGAPVKRKPALRMTVPRVTISEKACEQAAKSILEHLGYTVVSLGKPIPVTCRACRVFQWAALTGNTAGVSDLLVTHETRWPKVWVMIETKRDRGRRREAQIKLADRGLLTFFVTPEEAVVAIVQAEQRMGVAPSPRVLRWLADHPEPAVRDAATEMSAAPGRTIRRAVRG